MPDTLPDFAPRHGMRTTDKYQVHRISFGDGYKQASPKGINNKEQSWSLTWTLNLANKQRLVSFIDSKKGAEPFYWTPPEGTQQKFTCEGTKTTRLNSGYWQVSAVFKKSYAP